MARRLNSIRYWVAAARRVAWRQCAGATLCAAALICGVFVLAASHPSVAGPPAPGGGAGRVKSGTGFFVSLDGFLMTSAHVVAGCANVSIWPQDGAERPAYPVATDARHDVALLYGGYDVPRSAAVLSHEPPRPGQDVYTLGFGVHADNPLKPTLIGGSYVGDDTASSGNRILLIHAKLRAGNSGGALVGPDGSLLGMVIGRDEARPDMGVAVPSDDIEALLSAQRIAPPLDPPQPAAPPALLSAISMLIQCAPPSTHAEAGR